MASRHTRPNGDTWIFVKAANGKRRAVRLGKLNEDEAEEAKRRLAKLERLHVEGEPLDPMTDAWLRSLTKKRCDRVIATGLVGSLSVAALPCPAVHTVGQLINEWKETLTVEQSTAANYRQTAELVRKYFGEDRDVATIVPADADKFVVWATAHGRVRGEGPMSRASISRGCRTVRRVFEFGLRLRWITDNPFAHVRSQGEVNPERDWYVTPALVDKLIETCTDAELSAMLALSRWATMRGPSEFAQLTWADIDWAAPTIRITAPKTARYAHRARRTAPLNDRCVRLLTALFGEADELVEPVFPRLGGADSSDLSQRVERLCRAVGVPLWEKTWTNLRASCETDWQAEGIEIFTTSEWMGHSPEVALRHYKRTKDRIADLPATHKAKRSTEAPSPKGEAQGEALRGSQRE